MRWNTTEVYQNLSGAWKIIHTDSGSISPNSPPEPENRHTRSPFIFH
jgi:hypothetical protein